MHNKQLIFQSQLHKNPVYLHINKQLQSVLHLFSDLPIIPAYITDPWLDYEVCTKNGLQQNTLKTLDHNIQRETLGIKVSQIMC